MPRPAMAIFVPRLKPLYHCDILFMFSPSGYDLDFPPLVPPVYCLLAQER